MKKVFILFFITIILVGCSLTNTPSAKVEKYLNNYINLSDDVIMSIDNSVSTEDLSN